MNTLNTEYLEAVIFLSGEKKSVRGKPLWYIPFLKQHAWLENTDNVNVKMVEGLV